MKAFSPQTPSFRRFVRPTFLEGAARVFDVANVLHTYRPDQSESAADENALRSDWMAVGNDIRQAIDRHIVAEQTTLIHQTPMTMRKARDLWS